MVSPIDIQKALSGMDYPAGKDDIVSHAERNEAGDDVLEASAASRTGRTKGRAGSVQRSSTEPRLSSVPMTSGRGFSEDMRLAHVLADQADSISMERFKAQDLTVETKPDLTPVTDADRAVEEQLRFTLSRARTRDAVMGEEFGTTGHGSRKWVLDPIDGTKNFVRGVPVWATLIALMDGDEAVVGLVSAPALNRRWWAAKDVGAWTGRRLENAVRCTVSKVHDLGDASLSYSSLSGWEERGVLDGFLDLTRAVWRTRGYGDFWNYVLLAEGAVDIAAEPEVSLWDLAPLDVLALPATATTAPGRRSRRLAMVLPARIGASNTISAGLSSVIMSRSHSL